MSFKGAVKYIEPPSVMVVSSNVPLYNLAHTQTRCHSIIINSLNINITANQLTILQNERKALDMDQNYIASSHH